ncbi:hypothetical protein [uncultured Acinetobacter sp.]|uniref:hypothetical protein n=1 Tax=uncultured Acinetobacter sp. TaxID=165433 RepID=UPI002584DAE0|nr:hypothetical protein [uncultured Acinetobacter sp.]
MSLFLFNGNNRSIEKIYQTSYGQEGILERRDLQEALKSNIQVIVPDCLVVAEEYAEWDLSRKRIDLLGIDRNANLIIIELKRSDSGDHMDLQAIRYASMVSTMTFEHLIKVFTKYRIDNGSSEFTEEDAKDEIEEFIGKDSQEIESTFGDDVRIFLVSADFSKELTTSVMWLNDRDLDITCIRIRPYSYNGETLINIQQIIPLPEAKDYQVKAQQKSEERRNSDRKYVRDYSKYLFNGYEYNKRNLVLAVIKSHILNKKITNFYELTKDFPKSLRNGRFYKKFDEIVSFNRYFSQPDELLNFDDGCYAVSNQWGAGNIEEFLEQARKLNYEIMIKE